MPNESGPTYWGDSYWGGEPASTVVVSMPLDASGVVLLTAAASSSGTSGSGQGTGGGSGTVTSVAIASANGFTGGVSSPTTTPTITVGTTVTGILKGNGTSVSAATPGADYQAPIILTTAGSSGAATLIGNTLNIPQYTAGGGSGTVTTVSVVSANGFAGSVANAATTPAITITTTVTGILKGNGTAIAAATAGADYQAPIALTTTGTSGAATLVGNTLNIPNYSTGGGSGTVTTVSVVTANGFAGTVANATTTPAITITTSVTGILKGNGTAIAAATPGTDYLTGNQAITLSGDASGSGATSISVTVAAINGVSLGSTTATAGNLLIGSGTAWVTHAVSGDGTLSSAGALSVTKTGGVAFAASATTDTTNASNIASGTLGAARLPNPSASTLGGIQSAAAVSHQWINSISTAGVPALSQPAFSDLSGAAAVAQLPVFVASGVSHAAGIVPDPGSSAGSTHFLREDATWAVPAGGGSPGGSNNQIQVNASGSFAGCTAILLGANNQLNLAEIATPGTQVAGDLWTDSTQHCLAEFTGSGTSANCLAGYSVRLTFVQVTNVTLNTPTTQSLISTTSAIGAVALPAGYLNVAGRSLRIKAAGYATTGATNGNTLIWLKLGASVVATCTTQNVGSNVTNRAWILDATITVKATGSTGKIDTTGALSFPNLQTFYVFCNGTTAGTQTPTTQVTLDLTAAYTLDLQVTCAAAGNSVTLTNLAVETLG